MGVPSLVSILLASLAGSVTDPLLPTPISLDYVRPLQDLTPQGLDAYTRTVTGDFDGDSLADLAYLHGALLEVMFAPALFMSQYDDVTSATDVAVLPGIGSPPTDSLLTVGSSGLTRLTLSYGGSQAFWLQTTLEAGWAGALRVDCREVSGQTWVFGLQSDARSVRARAKGVGTGWVEGPLFTTTFDVSEIAALDYDGGGDLELAVVGEHRWEIWRRSGAPFQPWVLAASGTHGSFDLLDVAVGAQDGSLTEWLALLAAHHTDPTRSFVIVHDLLGTQTPVEVDGQPEAVAMAAGDFDASGDDDLVLSIRASFDALVLTNQGTGSSPAFDGDRSGSFPPTATVDIPATLGSPADTQAQPAAADLDNDDRMDFCLPIQGSGELFVHRDNLYGPAVPPTGYSVLANSAGGMSVEDEDLPSSTCAATQLLVPVSSPVASRPNNVQLLESHLWVQRPGESTTATTIDYHEAAFVSGIENYDLDLLLDSDVGAQPGGQVDETIYFKLVCFAQTDTAGNVIRIARPRLIGFQTACELDDACGNDTYLQGLANGPDFTISSEDCGTGIITGVWTGGGSPLPCLPDLPLNTVPVLTRMSASSN